MPTARQAADTREEKLGELARLRRALEVTPNDHVRVRTIREIAPKECEADLKANDALLMRGNQLLAASGVALSLLVGFSSPEDAQWKFIHD